jgi:hypothetical protein
MISMFAAVVWQEPWALSKIISFFDGHLEVTWIRNAAPLGDTSFPYDTSSELLLGHPHSIYIQRSKREEVSMKTKCGLSDSCQ